MQKCSSVTVPLVVQVRSNLHWLLCFLMEMAISLALTLLAVVLALIFLAVLLIFRVSALKWALRRCHFVVE